MACPLITGKGYSFSDPVIERGTVGSSVRAAVEFTIFPQEGYFLRADHFYVNSSSDFISQVQFIQNGNNVNVIATLDVDTWPGENTALDLDIEYLYIQPFGLDPIVRVQTIRILPINDANITTMLEDGTVVPTEGVEITITGMCGEVVDLPIINVSPSPGLSILDPEENIDVDVSDPKLDVTARPGPPFELDPTYTFDETDTEALTDEEGNLIDEDGNDVTEENAVPVDDTGVEVTIEGIDIMLGLPFEDIVDEDLLEPDAQDIGLSVAFAEQRTSQLGGPVTAEINGSPGADISWSLDQGSCTLPPVTEASEDLDGCPVNIETAQPTTGSVTLDTSGNGTVEFTTGQEADCCTYTLTVTDMTNSLTDTATVEQCDETTFTICVQALDAHPDLIDGEVVFTSTAAPGTSIQYVEDGQVNLPLPPSGQWLLNNPTVNPLDDTCWDVHPREIFECLKLTPEIVSPNLELDWSFTDGIQPDSDLKITLDLDCFAEDPNIPVDDVIITYCVQIVDPLSVTSVDGPFFRTGQPGAAIDTTDLVFTVLLDDTHTWVGTGIDQVVPTITVAGGEDFTNGNPSLSLAQNLTLRATPEGVFPASNVKITYTFTATPAEVPPPVVDPPPAVAIPGCTDPTAENYNPDATEDDGSCTFPPPPPVPQFSCTVNIVNNVPNTQFTGGIETTQVFGPHAVGTTFDGMFDIESVDGYDSLDFSTVTVVQDPVQLTINGTMFFGIQTLGDSVITITLTGDGPNETPPPPAPLTPLACPLDNLTVEVGGDGSLTGTLNEGILLELLPSTLPLDGNRHRVNYRMEVPTGFSNAGDTLVCGGPLITTEAPPPGMVSACVRSFDLISGDQLVTSNYIRLYTEEILTTFETDLEQFRVDDGQPFFIPAEDNIEDFYLFAVLNTDSYQGQLGSRFSTDAYVQDAEDQDGNQINNGRQNLAASYFPAFSGLDGIFTTDGFASSGITIALRWQQTDTLGPSKVYFDIDINVGELTPIPQPGNILINVIKHPDSLWTPVEYGGNNEIFDDPNNGFQIEIAGLSGSLGSSNNEIVYFGLLNDQPQFYGPGDWDTGILEPLTLDYWTDQGYSVNGTVSDFIFADTVYTKMEFVSYTTGDGTVVTDDPYPNIGIGAVIDDTAKTIEQVSSSFVRFRNFPIQGYHGSTDGTSGISLAHRCDDRSQAFVTTAVSVFSSASRLDPRGGTAIYNMYIDPPIDPPVQQNGTLLYTDESSQWQGDTVDNTTIDREEYDWGTQDVGSTLDEQTFVFTTDRGYTAIPTDYNFDFTIIERSWVDECNVNNIGPRDAAESEITITDAYASNINQFGERGSVVLTVAGQPTDIQLSNRDSILDLNIEGSLPALDTATFEVKLIDNFRNGVVSEASTYSGFETEWFPENTPFVVSSIPDDGYEFRADTVSSVTISTDDSEGPNLDIFDNGDISFDTTTVPGQLIVQVQPDAMQELVSGHTVLCLIADTVPTGPPWEEDDDLLTRQAVFAPVTDDVGNFTVEATPAVDGAAVAATVQLSEFNTADSNSENNETYTIRLIPGDTFSFNPLTLTLGTLGTFKNVAGDDPTDNLVTSNLRLADNGTDVLFDCHFTFTSIPDPDPILVFLDVPEDSIVTDAFVQVQFDATEAVDDAVFFGDTTVLHGGLQPGDTVTATFILRPDLYFNIETAPTATLDQSEITFDSTATVTTGALANFNRGVFVPQQATYTVSYTVSTDDFQAIAALSDRTYNIGIALTGAVVPVMSTLRINVIDHPNAVSPTADFSMEYPSGPGLDNVNETDFAPQWDIPADNSLHWFRDRQELTNIGRIRHVSGEDFAFPPGVFGAQRFINTDPVEGSGSGSYKTMNVSGFLLSWNLMPEGVHTYSVELTDDPADDTINRFRCDPDMNIPWHGAVSQISTEQQFFVFDIRNDTDSGTDIGSTVVTRIDPDGTETDISSTVVQGGGYDNVTVLFPAVGDNITEADETSTFRVEVFSEFGSMVSKTLSQDPRPRTEQPMMTDLNIIYDLSALPANIARSGDILNTNFFTDLGGDRWQRTFTDWPGRRSDEEVIFTNLTTGVNLTSQDPLKVWSPTPQADGNLTFTAPDQSSNINGRLSWGIPNTPGLLTSSRGRVFQDPFDGTISDQVTVQNSLVYDFHPIADTTIEIDVTGMLTEIPGAYECDSMFEFVVPAPDRAMTITTIPINIANLFANDTDNTLLRGPDETTIDTSDLNMDPWYAGCSVQSRWQNNQSLRFQLLYGDTDGNNLGVFTDSGWIGTFFPGTETDKTYNGIYINTSNQEIWDIPGWYGYGFGAADIDTYFLNPDTGDTGTSFRANFDPTVMADGGNGNGINDADTHLNGLGNFVSLSSFNNRFVATAFQVEAAINWYVNRPGASALAPRHFFLRVMGARSNDGVMGQGQIYSQDTRITSRCFQRAQGANFGTAPLPGSGFNASNTDLFNRSGGAIDRGGNEWTVDRDTTYIT